MAGQKKVSRKPTKRTISELIGELGERYREAMVEVDVDVSDMEAITSFLTATNLIDKVADAIQDDDYALE